MRLRRPLTAVLSLLVAAGVQAKDLEYVALDGVSPGAVVIDTRDAKTCMNRSAAGARCLPASDLTGPHGELPSPPDLLWALGTAGLTGHETVLVAGDSVQARDFVAGLLYLCGQRRVQVLDRPLSRVLEGGQLRAGPGTERGMLRSAVFTARMRDGLWMLRRDLSAALVAEAPVVPVDGRDADGLNAEIPGAVHVPLRALQTGGIAARRRLSVLTGGGDVSYVAYGRGPTQSIALFARLRASIGADVRVFPGGWQAWYAANVKAHEKAVPGASPRLVRGAGIVLIVLSAALFLGAMTLKRGKRWT